MEDATGKKWYFRSYTLVIGFLCIGPFILPLLWFNPGFNLTKKIVISLAILIVSYYMAIVLAGSLKSLNSYYQQLSQLLK